jgi:transposase-like protein
VVGQCNIQIHSRAERRYKCTTCGRTFAETRGTPYYRKRTAHDVITLVLTSLTHGCPLQAIVAAFGLDERTVAAWQQQAGQQGRQVHAHVVQQRDVDLQHVQADELWVKMVGRRVWMAMAMAVPSRLWLGGVISPPRDLALITTLVQMVRSCARSTAILVCVDGLASYVTAFRPVFRDPVRTGRPGRPRLGALPGFLLGQVIKRQFPHHACFRISAFESTQTGHDPRTIFSN